MNSPLKILTESGNLVTSGDACCVGCLARWGVGGVLVPMGTRRFLSIITSGSSSEEMLFIAYYFGILMNTSRVIVPIELIILSS